MNDVIKSTFISFFKFGGILSDAAHYFYNGCDLSLQEEKEILM
ncbi:hypothetical protein [Neobacillus muris]|nr:hypothetical protein [Neobacillus muris]